MIPATDTSLHPKRRWRGSSRRSALGIAVATLGLLVWIAAACTGGGEPKSQETAAPTSDAPRVAAEVSATATATPAPVPESPATPVPTEHGLEEMDVEPAFPALSFRRPIHLTYPPDGSNRLFVTLQAGRVMVFDNNEGVQTAREFLDIRARVSDRGNEEGLLGLAFHPEFESNGYFYVYYTAADPRRSVVSRFSGSDDPGRGGPESEAVILKVPQPFQNHNGGQVVFGPDGFLYIGLGDGGGGGDSAGNGQDPSTLLGSILRIDVSSLDSTGTYSVPDDNPFAGGDGGAREEVWAYGLRNPWRFTFDRATGDMWVGDVGQNRYEEVDIVVRGKNYGWSTMEASHTGCDGSDLVPPVIEYGRDDGCSITGGYVYRGARLPSLLGAYVYGDFCSGKIWALRHDGTGVTEHMLIVDSELSISSFGEDELGELFVVSLDGGIYRLVER